ncbi:MAG: DUF1351 domain-containing protein [Spirochaetia bacterium]|nr:DUF1351 domain-containing protein [Spirochaetia bacterium]
MDIALRSEVFPGEIRNNLNTFIKEVEKVAASYQGLVFDQDDIKPAKKAVAELRKYKKDIEDRRKKVKRDWLAPYDAFEKEVKKATSCIDKAITPISQQISEAEQQRIEDKKESIHKLKETVFADSPAKSFIDASWFDETRWLNSTVSLKKIEEELEVKKLHIQNDLTAIQNTNTAYTQRLLEEYRRHGDLSAAIGQVEALKEEAAEAKKLQEELDRKKAETAEDSQKVAKKLPQEEKILTEVAGGCQKVAEKLPQEEEKILTVTFTAAGTYQQLKALRDFCREQNISLERIPG